MEYNRRRVPPCGRAKNGLRGRLGGGSDSSLMVFWLLWVEMESHPENGLRHGPLSTSYSTRDSLQVNEEKSKHLSVRMQLSQNQSLAKRLASFSSVSSNTPAANSWPSGPKMVTFSKSRAGAAAVPRSSRMLRPGERCRPPLSIHPSAEPRCGNARLSRPPVRR